MNSTEGKTTEEGRTTDLIIQHINRCLEKSKGQAIAAFDADGTLWPMDVGKLFFQYQLHHNLIKDREDKIEISGLWDMREILAFSNNSSPPATLPEKATLLETTSPLPGVAPFPETTTERYLWFAQINAGQKLETVQNWASEAIARTKDFPIFCEQKEIIDHLHAKAVEIFIITASVKWSVEPAAAQFYNIDKDHVLGVSTKIVDKVITDKSSGPVTYKAGKTEALQKHTKGVRPFFCSGNTEGDLHLLESSTDIKVVISSATKKDMHYNAEQKMKGLAQQRKWYVINNPDIIHLTPINSH